MRLRKLSIAAAILLLVPAGLAQAAEEQREGDGAARQESNESVGRSRSTQIDEVLAAFEQARLAHRLDQAQSADTFGTPQSRNAGQLQAAFPQDIELTRIGGENRYDTAALLSVYANDAYFDEIGENFPVVFVATGLDYPDALAASAVQAPILLTQRNTVPVETMEAIEEIDPEVIVVVGGTNVVSPQVEQYLFDNSRAEVFRISGADRYDTAAQISQEFSSRNGIVYLTTGQNFPDALAAGPATGREGASVLLTMRDSLPSATATELDRLDPELVVVVGGPGAVSEAVLNQAAQYATFGAERRAGDDRYATAVEVGIPVFTVDDTLEILLATGVNFPDALAAGPAAFWRQGPVLLMKPTCTPAVVQDRVEELAPWYLTLVGGESAIADTALDVTC